MGTSSVRIWPSRTHWRTVCDCPDRPSYGFNELIRKIVKAFYSTKDTWRVDFFLYCPSGQKRSVSMARILTHALHHHGYKVWESVHHSVDLFNCHNAKCRYCGNDQWLQTNETRTKLLNYATNCITRMCKDMECS